MIKEAAPAESPKTDFLDLLWDFFSSVKMAIWLLSVSAVAVLIGTVVEQNQPMQKYLGTYGPSLAKIMQAMDVFDLYHSWWFEILMSLICLNLILSNFNRAEKLFLKYSHPPLRMDSAYYANAPAPRETRAGEPVAAAAVRLENALLRMRYRVQSEAAPEAVYYYADRGRLAMWGSFVAHIGLLLLFAGVVYGHFPGQAFERSVLLPEGGSYYVPESRFTINLKKFEAKWDEDRRPLLYRSTVEVVPDDAPPFTKAIEVNVPLVYRGVKTYQATYGPARIIGHYLDRTGKRRVIDIPYQEDQMMFFSVDPGNGGQWIGVVKNFVPDFAVNPATGEVGSVSKEPVNPGCFIDVVTRVDKMPPDPKTIKQAGWITRTQSAQFGGVKFYLDKVPLFSGFQLRRDPGVPIIYAAFIVIILGICLTFYIHHKVIRARIDLSDGGTRVLLVGARRDREQEYDKEFQFIAEKFEKRNPDSDGSGNRSD